MPLLLSVIFLGWHEITLTYNNRFDTAEAALASKSESRETPTTPTPWAALEFPDYTRVRVASFARPVTAQRKIQLNKRELFSEFYFAGSSWRRSQLATQSISRQLPILSRTSLLSLARSSTSSQQQYTVVLDPGHGGTDPGTVGAEGLLEKELTLDIANQVRDLLRTHPTIKVRLTRETDRGFSRDDRVQHIRASQADLLVSLHLNNLPQRELTVVETFYADRENILESELERAAAQATFSGTDKNLLKVANNGLPDYSFTEKSRKIAHLLQRYIYREVAGTNPSAIDNGVKTDTLFTLTRSRMPAALIELTCLSNKSEEQRLKSADYRQKISLSIAEALIEYFATLDTPRSV